MNLKDILKTNVIFKSTIFDDTVAEIRDFLDPKENNAYLINSIDSYMAMEYGDWEIVPDLKDDDDELDTDELARRVDTVIACNKYYWEKLLQSVLAEFNPLWNVDGTERHIHDYGQHVQTDSKAKVKTTDKFGKTTTTESIGDEKHVKNNAQVTTTNKNNIDDSSLGQNRNTVKTSHGERLEAFNTIDRELNIPTGKTTKHRVGETTTTHKETTMDNTAAFSNKTQDIVSQGVGNDGEDYEDVYANRYKPFDDTVSTGPTKNESTVSQHEDTETITHRRNASDAKPEANVTEVEGPEDTHETDAHTDTFTSQPHQDVETIVRTGNIGVTMTTQLLRDFQKFARESRLVPIISIEIAKALAFSVWY